jgi:hypothetical protein
MKQSGPYLKMGCSGGTLPTLGNNAVHDPEPERGMTLCGANFSSWVKSGRDNGTTLSAWPPAAEIISAATRLLGM